MTDNTTNYDWAKSAFKNMEVLNCFDCRFQVTGLYAVGRITQHCKRFSHGIVDPMHTSIEDFISQQLRDEPRINKRIALCYLCWNTAAISADGVSGLVHEAQRLTRLGNKASVIVLDNGSDDDTMPRIKSRLQSDFGGQPSFVHLHRNSTNKGISVARNSMIQFAVDSVMGLAADYVLMLDGDIQIVPLSTYTMTRYLECHTDVGCIGANSTNWTTEPKHAARHLTEIKPSRVHRNVRCAWTQYGMFRGSMFSLDGLMFDESGPFGQPGWGFEDDDLYYQMQQAGWINAYFNGMRYLHRALRSSWPSIEKLGLSVQDRFQARQRHLVNKWRAKGLSPVILGLISAQKLPKR
jgi:cellulose synthase/poly-beta-1,6-N-acetylglucosamine synthase-like glycosyltransferase